MSDSDPKQSDEQANDRPHIPGGQVPFEGEEDDAMWDRVWNRFAAQEDEAAARNRAAEAVPVPATADDDIQARAEAMSEIVEALFGPDAAAMLDDRGQVIPQSQPVQAPEPEPDPSLGGVISLKDLEDGWRAAEFLHRCHLIDDKEFR